MNRMRRIEDQDLRVRRLYPKGRPADGASPGSGAAVKQRPAGSATLYPKGRPAGGASPGSGAAVKKRPASSTAAKKRRAGPPPELDEEESLTFETNPYTSPSRSSDRRSDCSEVHPPRSVQVGGRSGLEEALLLGRAWARRNFHGNP